MGDARVESRKGCYDGEIDKFVGEYGFPGRGLEWGSVSGGGGVGEVVGEWVRRCVVVVKSII